MKEEIVNMLAKELDINQDKVDNLLEKPPKDEMGDYAFPCFSFNNPIEFADKLVKKLRKSLPSSLQGIEAKSGYVNFFIDKKKLANKVLKDEFYINKDGKKVVIEFPSPNTNKPLHIGHLRNIAIGDALSNILSYMGKKVNKTNLYNDRGILICKSMLGYEKFGKGRNPSSEKKKPDHFVGDFYKKFNMAVKELPKLEEDAKDLLVKWEAGDPSVLRLWRKMNNWVYKGFEETFRKFSFNFEARNYYESRIYDKGRQIVEN
ncbi:MAG: arginine--tRNA ligase, partial [Candidatus Nanoarchaeia archaeon]